MKFPLTTMCDDNFHISIKYTDMSETRLWPQMLGCLAGCQHHLMKEKLHNIEIDFHILSNVNGALMSIMSSSLPQVVIKILFFTSGSGFKTFVAALALAEALVYNLT